LLEIKGNDVLVDVSGVGYEVEVAASVLEKAPQTGQSLTLYTHFVVREDAQLLFGFSTASERDLFRGFIKINGVGPKLALSLLSSLDVATLAMAVRTEDISMLTRVPGIGKKTAERLLLELKNRLDDLSEASGVSLAAVDLEKQGDLPVREAENALIALGYKPVDASRMIAAVMARSEGELTVEDMIRLSLRSIAGQRDNAGGQTDAGA